MGSVSEWGWILAVVLFGCLAALEKVLNHRKDARHDRRFAELEAMLKARSLPEANAFEEARDKREKVTPADLRIAAKEERVITEEKRRLDEDSIGSDARYRR